MILGYIDPGTGTLIWQAAVSAVVGVFFYLTKTRRWIVGTLRNIFGRGRKTAAGIKTVAAKTPAEAETKSDAP